MTLLDMLITEPSAPATASVIWLHGLGASGHDFAGTVPELCGVELPGVRFIFPHAPTRPISVNGGMSMPGWYDITHIGLSIHEDEAGIRAADQQLRALIDAEHEKGIPYHRIVLAGFSQGGALALFTGLRHPERLAGIIALSTYLPLANTLAAEKSDANQITPVLLMHGTLDPVVPFAAGQSIHTQLQGLRYDVEWHHYPMLHSVCPEQLTTLGQWLHRVVGIGS